MDQQSEDLIAVRVYGKTVSHVGLHFIFSSLKLKKWRGMGRSDRRDRGGSQAQGGGLSGRLEMSLLGL